MNIDKQTVIAITGASRGLGAQMAKDFSQHQATLILLDRDIDALEQFAKTLQKSNPNVSYYAMDVSDEAQVVDTFTQVQKTHNCLDVLINNAGILQDGFLIKQNDHGEFDGLDFNKWQSVINVNLTGVFLCGREAAKIMAKNQQGVIINISSICRAGNIGQSNYSAAKAGVVALATTWAKELAQFGIRAAAIAPGFIETEMTKSMPEKAIERVKKVIPLQKMGQMEHISHTAQFIIENDYISGRVIEVDGGLRL